jgi:hypothetical protein
MGHKFFFHATLHTCGNLRSKNLNSFRLPVKKKKVSTYLPVIIFTAKMADENVLSLHKENLNFLKKPKEEEHYFENMKKKNFHENRIQTIMLITFFFCQQILTLRVNLNK